jgi:hypothetical protein
MRVSKYQDFARNAILPQLQVDGKPGPRSGKKEKPTNGINPLVD